MPNQPMNSEFDDFTFVCSQEFQSVAKVCFMKKKIEPLSYEQIAKAPSVNTENGHKTNNRVVINIWFSIFIRNRTNQTDVGKCGENKRRRKNNGNEWHGNLHEMQNEKKNKPRRMECSARCLTSHAGYCFMRL